jgi:hypothetical protein
MGKRLARLRKKLRGLSGLSRDCSRPSRTRLGATTFAALKGLGYGQNTPLEDPSGATRKPSMPGPRTSASGATQPKSGTSPLDGSDRSVENPHPVIATQGGALVTHLDGKDL